MVQGHAVGPVWIDNESENINHTHVITCSSHCVPYRKFSLYTGSPFSVLYHYRSIR